MATGTIPTIMDTSRRMNTEERESKEDITIQDALRNPPRVKISRERDREHKWSGPRVDMSHMTAPGKTSAKWEGRGEVPGADP